MTMTTTTRTASRWTTVDTALGELTLVAGPAGVEAVHFPERAPALASASHDPQGLADAAAQLRDLVAGRRRMAELQLNLPGTPLQQQVWGALRAIPYGSTVSYGELAASIGRAGMVRPVAAAVAATPTPILVPCHRVVGSDGALRGYVGGLARKAALLELERGVAGDDPDRSAQAAQLEII